VRQSDAARKITFFNNDRILTDVLIFESAAMRTRSVAVGLKARFIIHSLAIDNA